MPSFKLILASQSPRRRQLLDEAGYTFVVDPPDDSAEDGPRDGESPPDFVSRVARQKAANVADRIDSGIVLGCDTVADCGGQILGKPRDRADAQAMLLLLSGKTHHVYSGVCLWPRPGNKPRIGVASSKLRMARLSERELAEYLDSGAWQGKAGGFGYQDELDWIQLLAGEESNVVGLPLGLLGEMLRDFGVSR